ncbi:MAG: trypsin-like peptidase domain-containing protein, partial [Acidobacteriaceae bacterium]
MPALTNQLVVKLRRLAVPTSLVAVAVVGSTLYFHQNNVHAAGVTAAPLDDNSVAALTSVDRAMESLASRVTPAIVNVAVTSKAEEQQADMQGGEPQEGLPPGFSQFFGNGGGRLIPQQPELQHGIGSGVIISPNGYIVTNNHVVVGATQIRVTLHDRRVLSAKVIGVD